MAKDIRDHGGGIEGEKLERVVTSEDPLGGTGGSDGGGTRAGEGDPSGADADAPKSSGGEKDLNRRGAMFEATDTLAGRTGSEPAAEASALGEAPGALADAKGLEQASDRDDDAGLADEQP
jgi:hypothetical protein